MFGLYQHISYALRSSFSLFFTRKVLSLSFLLIPISFYLTALSIASSIRNGSFLSSPFYLLATQSLFGFFAAHFIKTHEDITNPGDEKASLMFYKIIRFTYQKFIFYLLLILFIGILYLPLHSIVTAITVFKFVHITSLENVHTVLNLIFLFFYVWINISASFYVIMLPKSYSLVNRIITAFELSYRNSARASFKATLTAILYFTLFLLVYLTVYKLGIVIPKKYLLIVILSCAFMTYIIGFASFASIFNENYKNLVESGKITT